MRPIVLALPLMLLLPAGFAQAQVRGSYRQSCTDIQQNGDTLSARCKAPSGAYNDTSIDLGACNGQPVANAYGRLTCGNVRGSANVSNNRRRYGDDEGGGYGNGGGGYGNGGYDAPRRRSYIQRDDDGYGAPPPRRRRYDPDQDY